MCMYPISLTEQRQVVPCGHCEECIDGKRLSWSIRLQAEKKHAFNSYFITLTYRDGEHQGVLVKEDLQRFFKKYRRRIDRKYGKPVWVNKDTGVFTYKKPARGSKMHKTIEVPEEYKLKYYAVGEYGGKTFRPHYHAIVYNVDIKEMHKAWDKGFTRQGQCNEARINYVTSYVINKQEYGKRKKYCPFAIMSKGLGKVYIDEATKKYHLAHFESTITLAGGKRVPMPRYIKERIWTCSTAIELLGEKNRITQNIALGKMETDEVIGRRNHRRITHKRNKKTQTVNL